MLATKPQNIETKTKEDAARLELYALIEESMQAFEEGRISTHEEVVERMLLRRAKYNE